MEEQTKISPLQKTRGLSCASQLCGQSDGAAWPLRLVKARWTMASGVSGVESRDGAGQLWTVCACGVEVVLRLFVLSGARLGYASTDTLQGRDGLAAPNVGCNRQEAPLGLDFKHVPWAHVGLGAQGGRFAGLVQPGLKPCYWEPLYLA